MCAAVTGRLQQLRAMKGLVSFVPLLLLLASHQHAALAQRVTIQSRTCDSNSNCASVGRTVPVQNSGAAVALAAQQRVTPNAGYVNITSVQRWKCYDNKDTVNYIGEPLFLGYNLNSTQTLTDASCSLVWYPQATSCDCIEKGTCNPGKPNWNSIWALDQHTFSVSADQKSDGWWCSWIKVVRTQAGKRGVVDTLVSYSVTTFSQP